MIAKHLLEIWKKTMNEDFYSYNKVINDLTDVLSIAYFYKFSMPVIEKRIVESKYFNALSGSDFENHVFISTKELLNEIFPDVETSDSQGIYYSELEWVSTMYINIVKKTNLNFETIFCYIGIEDSLRMFKMYHEIDLSNSLEKFEEARKQKSIIKIKMKELKITNDELSKETELSSPMINALKNRKRDVKKLDVYHAIKLAKSLKIGIETLLNN